MERKQKQWIKKLVLFTPKLYRMLEKEAVNLDMDINSLIRKILYEYFEPKPQIQSNSAVDPKKVEELLKLNQEQMEKMKDLDLIKKRLDSLISEPEEDLSEIINLCRSPKTLFELSRETNKQPEQLIVILRWLVKNKKMVEKDGKYRTV